MKRDSRGIILLCFILGLCIGHNSVMGYSFIVVHLVSFGMGFFALRFMDWVSDRIEKAKKEWYNKKMGKWANDITKMVQSDPRTIITANQSTPPIMPPPTPPLSNPSSPSNPNMILTTNHAFDIPTINERSYAIFGRDRIDYSAEVINQMNERLVQLGSVPAPSYPAITQFYNPADLRWENMGQSINRTEVEVRERCAYLEDREKVLIIEIERTKKEHSEERKQLIKKIDDLDIEVMKYKNAIKSPLDRFEV